MLIHNIQQKVVDKLARAGRAHFAELKPKNVESNAFNYHLKSLIKEGIVIKNEDGLYSLSTLGMKIGVNADMSFEDWVSQAHSVMLMTVIKDGKIILRRRQVEPMQGYLGLIYGEPRGNMLVTDSAKISFEKSTGLIADFEVRGSGFSRFLNGIEVESFTNITILTANDCNGELKPKGDTGENVWMDINEAKKSKKLFPNMPIILEKLEKDDIFWLDLLQNKD